jgi:hypothetical protein
MLISTDKCVKDQHIQDNHDHHHLHDDATLTHAKAIMADMATTLVGENDQDK